MRQVGRACRISVDAIKQKVSSTPEREKRLREANRTFLTEAIALARDPLVRYQLGITLDINNKHAERAIRRSLHFLDKYEQYSRIPLLHRLRTRLESFVIPLFQPSTVDSNLSSSMFFLRGGDLSATEHHLAAASSLEGPSRVQALCLYSYFLSRRANLTKNKERGEQARLQWQSTLEHILDDSNTSRRFQLIGASRNEVLEIRRKV